MERISHHTFYVAGIEDVAAEIAKRAEEVEAHASLMGERMAKAGWSK